MLLDRLTSLRRKLLTVVGPSGREEAPLRAYGKLEFHEEYLRVGCDGLPAASAFASWMDGGVARCERVLGKNAFRVQRHRLLWSTDRGRIWVVACLWDSRDRRSEQGHQRNFPFALFVIVPAPDRNVPWHFAPALCSAIWSGLERRFDSVSAASTRAEFDARVRSNCVPGLPKSDDCDPDPQGVAKTTRLADWFAALLDQSVTREAFYMALQRGLLEFRNSRGSKPLIWRMPIAARWDSIGQTANWFRWLQVNLESCWTDFAVHLPSETAENKLDAAIVLRGSVAEDFALLLEEPGQVDSSLPPRLADGAFLPPGHDGFVRILEGKLPPASATLAEFAKTTFPRPT